MSRWEETALIDMSDLHLWTFHSFADNLPVLMQHNHYNGSSPAVRLSYLFCFPDRHKYPFIMLLWPEYMFVILKLYFKRSYFMRNTMNQTNSQILQVALSVCNTNLSSKFSSCCFVEQFGCWQKKNANVSYPGFRTQTSTTDSLCTQQQYGSRCLFWFPRNGIKWVLFYK